MTRDEAEDAAEILLRDRTLTSYPTARGGACALKGLLLAAYDAQRGVLTSEQIIGIEAALEELVPPNSRITRISTWIRPGTEEKIEERLLTPKTRRTNGLPRHRSFA